ncbi:phospho-sugar mutase, partial [Lactobacillus sp. XV13L]|nr:phospho-sugar mutase [Lactobacillus sp. XV13L]
FKEKTISKTFSGVDGSEKMERLMAQFRHNESSEINGTRIVSVQDFQTSVQTNADGTSQKLALPKSNVLKFLLADGTWIAIRPSGTEPKIKNYVGVEAPNEADANEKLAAYAEAINSWY